MAISWRLKTYLATKHGIYRVTAFQKRITKKTGVLISIQNLCNYLNAKPKAIRLKTLELIVTALECNLNDFLEITPQKSSPPCETKKLSYQNTPLSKRALKNFPDPKDYK